MHYSLSSSEPTGMINHLFKAFMEYEDNKKLGKDVLDVLFYRYCHVLFKKEYLPIVEEYIEMASNNPWQYLPVHEERFEWNPPID